MGDAHPPLSNLRGRGLIDAWGYMYMGLSEARSVVPLRDCYLWVYERAQCDYKSTILFYSVEVGFVYV